MDANIPKLDIPKCKSKFKRQHKTSLQLDVQKLIKQQWMLLIVFFFPCTSIWLCNIYTTLLWRCKLKFIDENVDLRYKNEDQITCT